MDIVIIGSGLMGTTAAYFLRRQGHEVTVIDRAGGPGQGASFANGAMLTPSMAEPWNSPGVWQALLSSLGRSNAPLKLHLGEVGALLGWGGSFLKNSKKAAFERNASSNLRLALCSLEIMRSLRRDVEIDYGYAARGTLRIFRESEAFQLARAGALRLTAQGLPIRVLSPVETLELEPALAPIGNELAGSIHYEIDETGDAHRFCIALAEQAREIGVQFHFATEVAGLEVRSGHVSAVVTKDRRFEAEKYVVAAGAYSMPLLRNIGIHLPIRPVKGYSITFQCAATDRSLRVPIVDDRLHAAVIPLDGVVRVAGTAEFAGYDLTLPPARIQNLLALYEAVLPRAECNRATAKPWCGLRPVSVDGVPLIGATNIENLIVNTGHGHLGWTLAAGSAQLLVELINNSECSVDPTPYDPMRFFHRR